APHEQPPPGGPAEPHRLVRAIRRDFPSTLDRERRGQCQSVRGGQQERLARRRTESPRSTPRQRLRESHKRARPALPPEWSRGRIERRERPPRWGLEMARDWRSFRPRLWRLLSKAWRAAE